MDSAYTSDNPAVYAIRVSGRLGPLLRSALRRAGLADPDATPPLPTVSFVVTGTDLVEVAERVTQQGIKIESLRTIREVDE